jgi:hypothetical protein
MKPKMVGATKHAQHSIQVNQKADNPALVDRDGLILLRI